MENQPKLLVWNFTTEEKLRLDAFLHQLGAPSALAIDQTWGSLTLKEIIDGSGAPGEAFVSDEKVILFHDVPQKGVMFLIDSFGQTDLPHPIYAVVTEHSVNWPFKALLEHLVEERDRHQRERA